MKLQHTLVQISSDIDIFVKQFPMLFSLVYAFARMSYFRDAPFGTHSLGTEPDCNIQNGANFERRLRFSPCIVLESVDLVHSPLDVN